MKNFLLGIALCISSSIAFGQKQILFNETTNPTYEFKFKNSSEDNQTQINTIIELLAKENNQSLRGMEYIVSYTQQLKITKMNREYHALVKINNLSVSGDTKCHDFDISDILIPDHLLLNIAITVAPHHTIKYEYNNTHYSLHPNQQEIEYTFTDSILLEEIKILINETQFVYSTQDINAIEDKINLIKSYYSTEAGLQTTYTSLQNLDPANLDLITINNTTLLNAEAFIDKLKKENFPSKLNLQKNDPIHYIQKLNSLIDLATKIRNVIDYNLKNIDQLYYNKGIDLLSYGKTEMAKDYFNKSVDFNSLFAPSHFQLASIDFENGNIVDAEARAKDIVYKMNPDPLTQEATFKLLYSISDVYYIEAKKRIQNQEFKAALDQLYKMQSICSSVPGMFCSKEMYEAIGQAKVGIYYNILDEASVYLEKDDLKNAEQKVSDASTFQKNNSTYIKSNADADEVLRKIYAKHYYNYINIGKQYVNNTNYQAALDEFEKAEKIENDFDLMRHVDLSALEKLAAKPVIKKLIDEGNSYVKQNYTSKAKSNITKIEQLQTKYGLTDDTEVNLALTDFKEKLYTQECLNTNHHYNQLVESANNKIFNKQFVEAQTILNQAKNYASGNGVCVIPSSLADQKLNEILAAATYQNMINESNNLINNQKYEQAVQNYINAGKYFEQYKITSFGLLHTATFLYISNASKSEFKIYGATYYMNQKEYEKALSLLTDVAHKNYKSSSFKQAQIRFGREKAIIDKTEKPSENPKVYVLKYTNNDKKLKYIRKAYVKQWKKMK